MLEETKVHANEALVEPKNYVLPHPFLDYLNDKARRMAALSERMSDKQHAKVEASFRENADQFVGSDFVEAMLADIAMFGDDAFSTRGPAGEDER